MTCTLLLVLSMACGRAPSGSQAGPEAQGASRDAYSPVYGAQGSGAREARGTIRGDFQWAADATTLADAASRWQAFLMAHDPPGGEYEDSVHASYVAAAQYELARVYYLQGRRQEGDQLFRQLDPIGWLK